ncbi:hypothetical protein AGMMS49992_17090 [Clostridia bacterium]|nr:hypothetical protein AGMMS49992_17090 [Clostridia bacterium]
MYCMQTCETKRSLYGIPLEPLPDPALFNDCSQEACGSEIPTQGMTGRGCLFDDFDPDVFEKPCCKSGCCSICNRIGDDAPFLVPHVMACMEGPTRWKNRSIRLKINQLPACRCMPARCAVAFGGLMDDCTTAQPDGNCGDLNPYGTSCCIKPHVNTGLYQVLCIRVRGVPTVEYNDIETSPAFVNDTQGYYLTARITLHLEVLLKDCCGYLYTVKTSYRLPNTMLLRFPLHCKLCNLGEANIYLKTKMQLCDDRTLGPGTSPNLMYTFVVNMAIDACIIKHIPYDWCGTTNDCFPSMVNGAHNISDPDNVNALDAPYMVPFPIACGRFRSERTMIPGPDGVPVYSCRSLAVPLPPAADMPGVGPWEVISAGATGGTKVAFWPYYCFFGKTEGECQADIGMTCSEYCANVLGVDCGTFCNVVFGKPCSAVTCNEFYTYLCNRHDMRIRIYATLALVVRDSLGDTYTIPTNYYRDMNINLGTAYSNICRSWLYVKTKFSLCRIDDPIATGATTVNLPIDVKIEACVMKLIPYQITGRDPHCNYGPWYYKSYCKYPIRYNNLDISGGSADIVGESGQAAEPGESYAADYVDETNAASEVYFARDPLSGAAGTASTNPRNSYEARESMPAGCRQGRRA